MFYGAKLHNLSRFTSSLEEGVRYTSRYLLKTL